MGIDLTGVEVIHFIILKSLKTRWRGFEMVNEIDECAYDAFRVCGLKRNWTEKSGINGLCHFG